MPTLLRRLSKITGLGQVYVRDEWIFIQASYEQLSEHRRLLKLDSLPLLPLSLH